MLLFFRLCFLCVVLVLLPTSPSQAKEHWQAKASWKLAQGPYLWEVGQSYGLVGHIVQGRVTLFDTQNWKKLGSQKFGQGQVYVDVQGAWGLVGLTSQKKLLLVALPSLRIHRSYSLPFFPYGVEFQAERPTSSPTSRPAKAKAHPAYAWVANQIGGALVRLNLNTGKVIQSKAFQWPLSTRSSHPYSVLIPLSGALQLLDFQWHVLHRWNFPGVVGDVALRGRQLALSYGDKKRSQGTLHLFQLPSTRPLWKASTAPRPRSVALTREHILTLSEKGWLQVFSHKGKQLQRTRIGKSGLVLQCPQANVCAAILPMEMKMQLIQKKAP